MTVKFIKLTEIYTDGRHFPLIINTAHVMSVKKASSGRDTHVNMVDKHYFFVKESVNEIEAML